LEFGATSSQELITQADNALYASKRAGRDRVTRWDRIGPETG
jgi:PleD family two-component response regulator